RTEVPARDDAGRDGHAHARVRRRGRRAAFLVRVGRNALQQRPHTPVRSTVKPCVVVPVYNHGTPLPSTIERLAPFELPIIVVDDGSDATTKSAIAAIARRHAVTVVTLPRNGGKGAAVMAGLRTAAAAGYTHALQVDADGQHDLDDLPKLLAA